MDRVDKTFKSTDNFMTLPVFNARPAGTAAVHHDTAKKGFTVVELMVVIGIIGMLMGLLLPAVQSAREAGRRNACGNNIRQIALALVDYGMKKSRLPGWRNAHPNGVAANSVTWAVPILPQLERNDIYETYRTGLGAPQQISLFLCPSKGSRDAGDTVIDYGANAGSTTVNVFPGGTQFNGDGVFYDTLGDVIGAPPPAYTKLTKSLDTISEKDGTATTLLVAESPISRNYGNSTIPLIPAAGVNGGLQSGPLGESAVVPVFGVLSAGIPGLGVAIPDRPINPPLQSAAVNERPGSLHPGGAMVAFCDGHTKFIGNELANHVFIQLMTSDMKWDNVNLNYVSSTPNGISPRVNQLMKDAFAPPYVLNEADIP
jgi:prepilin-type N-terminal cleavage/methylation domain-containing protein/prepilin-type processing-associated H-X9-DG protein